MLTLALHQDYHEFVCHGYKNIVDHAHYNILKYTVKQTAYFIHQSIIR
jgi:hypothetical protein